jgi:hypothetical protein
MAMAAGCGREHTRLGVFYVTAGWIGTGQGVLAVERLVVVVVVLNGDGSRVWQGVSLGKKRHDEEGYALLAVLVLLVWSARKYTMKIYGRTRYARPIVVAVAVVVVGG